MIVCGDAGDDERDEAEGGGELHFDGSKGCLGSFRGNEVD